MIREVQCIGIDGTGCKDEVLLYMEDSPIDPIYIQWGARCTNCRVEAIKLYKKYIEDRR